MKVTINTSSTWILTQQARETRASWSDISCLTHGYYIFSGYSKCYSGRHRISQWRRQKRTLLAFCFYCMFSRSHFYGKCEGSGKKKKGIECFLLPPDGSLRVDHTCIPCRCRSMSYSVRYNVDGTGVRKEEDVNYCLSMNSAGNVY